jgi:putative PIN family toxin of toxin-antitoxin system
MLRVVLDTNIIISSFHRKEGNPALVVALLLDNKFKLCLSEEIFAEYRDVLGRDRFKYLDQAAIKRILARLKKNALWVCPKTTIEAIKDDPEDNKFRASALESQADFLVTGNTKHFPFRKFHMTRIATPGEFVQVFATSLMNVIPGHKVE